MKRRLAIASFLLSCMPVFAQEDGLKSWEKIHAVLSHPRCANCHTPDDHPRWGDTKAGTDRVHPMNVVRGADGSGMGNPGMRCTTCHGAQNSAKEHAPPGAPAWHLAPVEMVWFGKTSAEICAQIKDPARNGNRTLADIAEHVKNDALVGWGWTPGPGREPAPGSIDETYADILAWTNAGAPCPQ
jgi:hypothetical protein